MNIHLTVPALCNALIQIYTCKEILKTLLATSLKGASSACRCVSAILAYTVCVVVAGGATGLVVTFTVCIRVCFVHVHLRVRVFPFLALAYVCRCVFCMCVCARTHVNSGEDRETLPCCSCLLEKYKDTLRRLKQERNIQHANMHINFKNSIPFSCLHRHFIELIA